MTSCSDRDTTRDVNIVDLTDFEAALRLAAAAIEANEAVIYPTDTVYALGVSAVSARAVDAAYAAKGRSSAKPLSLCVADIEQARAYVEIDARAETLARAFLPGALTLVCASRNVLPMALQAGFPGIGIRVPGHPFGPALARRVGYPITTTSANASGLAAATDRETALAAFADADEQPSLLVDGGPSPIASPSTVVDLTGPEPRLVREGAIPFDAVLEALKAG
jgi:L-threonylcarbamoyladenylate synthase